MFKSAATKIAHNTTIPSLGGNKDLRPLQDLIIAEKAVLMSLQRLSVDFSKAAEALRIWGTGEGDDLGDILGASASLLTIYSSAISQYATHGHPMRDHLKSIRTREENLDDLKRRRKSLGAKAETMEKKLSKMGPEHKNLQMQTDGLNALRMEIRTMDSDIMSEEAFLGDFKRSTTRTWMGLKFGGLLECSEKGIIAGEYGKLIITEISEEQTQPGMARSLYYGRPKTEALLSEAHRCINEVVMSTVPSSGQPLRRSDPPQLNIPTSQQHTPQQSYQNSPMDMGGPGMSLGGTGPPDYLPPSQGFGTGQFLDQPRSSISPPGSPTHQRYPAQPQQTPTTPYYPQIEPHEPGPRRSLDDFGVSGPINHPGPGSGGRFATFPVKNRPPEIGSHALPDTSPTLGMRSENDDSFSSSIAQALRSSQSPPGNDPQASFAQLHQVSHPPSYMPPAGPPPGAQLATGDNWNAAIQSSRRNMVPTDAMSTHPTNPQEPYHDNRNSDFDPQYDSPGRHVRFSEDNNIIGETERRGRHPDGYIPQEEAPQYHEQEFQHQQQQQPSHQPQARGSIDSARIGSEPLPPPTQVIGGSGNNSPTSSRFQNQHHVAHSSTDTAEDERALNAAAAREISREMDKLTFDPPVSQIRNEHSLREGSPARDGPNIGTTPSIDADNAPLVPPSAPFTRRTPSPRPSTDVPPYPGPSPYHSPAQPSTQASPQVQYQLQDPQYERQLPPPDIQSAIPPRIDTAIPPTINLPERPRFSPRATQSPSPYQTPPEHPRPLGIASTPLTKSTSSLNSQVPAGARTISAAAFKRPTPRMASGDIPSDTSPLSLKKRLPSSPYPQQREGSPLGRDRSGSLPPSQPPPTNSPPAIPKQQDVDEDYDYLGAYVNTGSPHEMGNLGPLRIANEPGARSQGGYSEGKFATDLEGNGSLR